MWLAGPPALGRGLEAPGAVGPLLKARDPTTSLHWAVAWAPEEGRRGCPAGLPRRKPVAPRWPRHKAGYRAGGRLRLAIQRQERRGPG